MFDLKAYEERRRAETAFITRWQVENAESIKAQCEEYRQRQQAQSVAIAASLQLPAITR